MYTSLDTTTFIHQQGRVKVSAGTNGVYGVVAEIFNHPYAMSYGDTVSSGMNFKNGLFNVLGFYFSNNVTYSNGSSGNFLGVSNQYIGVKFKIESEWHYGWVGVDVGVGAHSFTIRDYSYNDIPDSAIFVGNKTTGLDKLEELNATVYAHNSEIKISIPFQMLGANLTVHNSMGQMVYNSTINNTQGSYRISESSKGLHVVKIQSYNKTISKKVILN